MRGYAKVFDKTKYISFLIKDDKTKCVVKLKNDLIPNQSAMKNI